MCHNSFLTDLGWHTFYLALLLDHILKEKKNIIYIDWLHVILSLKVLECLQLSRLILNVGQLVRQSRLFIFLVLQWFVQWLLLMLHQPIWKDLVFYESFDLCLDRNPCPFNITKDALQFHSVWKWLKKSHTATLRVKEANIVLEFSRQKSKLSRFDHFWWDNLVF